MSQDTPAPLSLAEAQTLAAGLLGVLNHRPEDRPPLDPIKVRKLVSFVLDLGVPTWDEIDNTIANLGDSAFTQLLKSTLTALEADGWEAIHDYVPGEDLMAADSAIIARKDNREVTIGFTLRKSS